MLAGRIGNPYSTLMTPLRARVQKGRLILDEPTTLPEGTVVDLVADDEGDDLTDEERRALHEALSASWKSAEAGRRRPASAVLNAPRPRRGGSGGGTPPQTAPNRHDLSLWCR